MKTFRKSASTETRNARKAIAFRGGTGGASAKLFESKHVLSGRRLRRAARSGARIEVFAVAEDGAQHRAALPSSLDPHTRALLSGDPRALSILGCRFS